MIREIQRSDFKQISEWVEHRGGVPINPDYYPEYGLIAEDIACGFMFATNSKVAFLDGFISNPAASITEVNHAINRLVVQLEEDAKESGFDRIIVMTRVPSINKRAKKLGYVEKRGDWSVLSKEMPSWDSSLIL